MTMWTAIAHLMRIGRRSRWSLPKRERLHWNEKECVGPFGSGEGKYERANAA